MAILGEIGAREKAVDPMPLLSVSIPSGRSRRKDVDQGRGADRTAKRGRRVLCRRPGIPRARRELNSRNMKSERRETENEITIDSFSLVLI